MGRGDKKSKKGKIWKGTYGNSRLKKGIKAKLKRVASVSRKTGEAAKAGSARKVVKKKESAE